MYSCLLPAAGFMMLLVCMLYARVTWISDLSGGPPTHLRHTSDTLPTHLRHASPSSRSHHRNSDTTV